MTHRILRACIEQVGGCSFRGDYRVVYYYDSVYSLCPGDGGTASNSGFLGYQFQDNTDTQMQRETDAERNRLLSKTVNC